MHSSIDTSGDGHVSLLTEADEVSLADAQSMVTDDSVADTLDVRSDAVGVMQDSMAPFRRPMMMAGAVLAVGLAVLIVGGVLGRGARTTVPPVIAA